MGGGPSNDGGGVVKDPSTSFHFAQDDIHYIKTNSTNLLTFLLNCFKIIMRVDFTVAFKFFSLNEESPSITEQDNG